MGGKRKKPRRGGGGGGVAGSGGNCRVVEGGKSTLVEEEEEKKDNNNNNRGTEEEKKILEDETGEKLEEKDSNQWKDSPPAFPPQEMANNNADSNWCRPTIKAIQIQKDKNDTENIPNPAIRVSGIPLYQPPDPWSDEPQTAESSVVVDFGKVVGVLKSSRNPSSSGAGGGNTGSCSSCASSAGKRDTPDNPPRGDPLMYATFVAPIHQFPLETSNKTVYNSYKDPSLERENQIVPPPDDKALYEQVPSIEEWPLPPIPIGVADDDVEDDFEISGQELDDQVRFERMTFISGSSANEDDDEELFTPPKIPPHREVPLWDNEERVDKNTGTIRRKAKKERNRLLMNNNTINNIDGAGEKSSTVVMVHRRHHQPCSPPDNVSESSASFHENDARVVVMSGSSSGVCERERSIVKDSSNNIVRESWQSSGSEYQGSVASAGTSSITDPSSLTPQPLVTRSPNLKLKDNVSSSKPLSKSSESPNIVHRLQRYDSESTSGCSSRARSRAESTPLMVSLRSKDATPEDDVHLSMFLPQDVGVSDCVDLNIDQQTESGFLKNLQMRFKKGQIYTNSGPILISINPYNKLPLYTQKIIESYRSQCLYQLPSHIYAIADRSWHYLRDTGEDQCLLFSGETGSGKTEASKLVLQYLAAITGHSRELHTIKYKLLQANPIIEAFGNARTIPNNNSSRFGKYTEVIFDFKGDPVGGHIHSYLLEKFRVTRNFPRGERNFHIFYQLLAGVDMQTLKDLYLQRSADDYELLVSHNSATGAKNVSTYQQYHNDVTDVIEDRKDFAVTKKAMEDVGLSSEEIMDIFGILSAILKLGNLQFIPDTNMDGTEGCTIANDYELYDVSEILHGEFSQLHNSFLTRSIETKGQVLVTDLSALEASSSRNTLCRALYSRLFTWMINRINESIKVRASRRSRILAILDMYGFEILDNNSFEQLIINFANEKLHWFILEKTMIREQEENISEGIEWKNVSFFSNMPIIDMIERGGNGVLSLLDETCHCGLSAHHFPIFGAFVEMDNHFLSALQVDHFRNNPYIALSSSDAKIKEEENIDTNKPKSLKKNQKRVSSFQIKHFAGSVKYDVENFCSKNMDYLDRDLSMAMYECDNALLKTLFPEGNPKRTTRRRPATSATQFKISISSLLTSLETKYPHYIWCIKPNQEKKPKLFEPSTVQHQIRYFSLLEITAFYRNGYSYRLEYGLFLDRYKMLSINTWPYWNGSPVDGVTYLLRELPISANDYTFGRTKIFIRSINSIEILEELRKGRMDELCTLIQKTWRGFKERKKWIRLKKAQITIANFWRRWKNKSHIVELKQRRKKEWACHVIQEAFKLWQRRRYLYNLAFSLPSESPLSKEWPSSSLSFLREPNTLLKKLYHKWRCNRYRSRFDQIARNRMREKVTASIIFKDRKASYYRSINHPFLGDYVRLRQNPQWKKICTETNDQYVVFADIINKITRSNAKFVPILFVISTSSMLIMDQRTMQIKYRIPASEIYKLSLSPYHDDIAVFHVRASSPVHELRSQPHIPGCLSSETMKRKGDFVLQTGHVIEIVTKLFLVIQNATGKPPQINIETEFEANFGVDSVTFDFKANNSENSQDRHHHSNSQHVKLVKRRNRMEVIF